MSASQTAFLGLLAAVAACRLVEVVVSLRRSRARAHAVVVEPMLMPLMVLVHMALLVAPAVEVLALDRPLVPLVTALAAAGLVLATALRVWTLRTIGRSWNVRVVVPDGARIATSGPYAWIRHPNYLVVVLEVACIPMLHGAWLSALALSLANALVLARRIATEEAALALVPAWREAMLERPRLIPGLL